MRTLLCRGQPGGKTPFWGFWKWPCLLVQRSAGWLCCASGAGLGSSPGFWQVSGSFSLACSFWGADGFLTGRLVWYGPCLALPVYSLIVLGFVKERMRKV